MKTNTLKYLLVSFMIFNLYGFVNGQSWQFNGNNTYYDDGNVGINDSTPEKDLTINGVQVVYGSLGTINFGDVTNTATGWGEYGIEYESGGLNFWKPYGNSYNGNTTNYIMFLKDNGNVGIGTSNPDYKLTVKGGIHARELKITNTAGGADFVFDPNYTPMNLENLEKFIENEQHLPEIPSADQMEEDGLDVGTFQIQLLQKIEELTLYIIELNKKNEALEQKFSSLENTTN